MSQASEQVTIHPCLYGSCLFGIDESLFGLYGRGDDFQILLAGVGYILMIIDDSRFSVHSSFHQFLLENFVEVMWLERIEFGEHVLVHQLNASFFFYAVFEFDGFRSVSHINFKSFHLSSQSFPFGVLVCIVYSSIIIDVNGLG